MGTRFKFQVAAVVHKPLVMLMIPNSSAPTSGTVARGWQSKSVVTVASGVPVIPDILADKCKSVKLSINGGSCSAELASLAVAVVHKARVA